MTKVSLFCCAICLVVKGVMAGTLVVEFTRFETGAVVDLTAEGTLDWVHWGLDTESSLHRKAGVPPILNNFTLLSTTNGHTVAYQYADNYTGYTWYDGAPRQVVTNTPTGIWAYGFPQVFSGFQLRAPATTNEQWLKVYVGAYAAKGLMVVSLSDQSVPPYRSEDDQIVSNITNGPGAVYTIRYAADSPDQEVIVTYTLDEPQGPDAAAGNVTLQAAALSGPDANNPPWVLIDAPLNQAASAGIADVPLAAAALDVDGSISLVEFFAGSDKVGESAGPTFSANWSNAPVGLHVVTARATDNLGGTRVSKPVNVFVHTAEGSLAGTRTLPPSQVNLTTEGTVDWAHWGLTSRSEFNHKETGGNQISDLELIGPDRLERQSATPTTFSWNDGTPVTIAQGSSAVYVTGLSNGFELSAPADTMVRTLRVYTGIYGLRGNIQAWLSDFSAPAYADASVSNIFGSTYSVYTVTYNAAGEAARIHVRYTSLDAFDFDYGSVGIQAASLQGPPAPLPPQLQDIHFTAGTITFSFHTEAGRVYLGQYANQAGETNWQSFTNIVGDGGIVWMTDEVSASERVYRVAVQAP